ncbi:MAG: ATP-binding protein [Nitrososphaerota archaeon]|jgi:hypothetical protein|nr:ATP-binding protein [Nitrososphaerota archaeon]
MPATRFDNAASDPLNDTVLSHLFNQKYETPSIDFKETLDTTRGSNFAKIARHFFAMSNYGGGFLLIGFQPKPTGGYNPVGLPSTFHLDQAEVQGKFNGLASIPLEIGYREFDRMVDGTTRRFAVVYVPPAPGVLVPKVDGTFQTERGKVKLAFAKGEVLTRRGTSTIRAEPYEIEWIRNRARDTAYQNSLLSGQPDRLEETIAANAFPALSMPQRIYICNVNLHGRSVPQHGLSSCLVQGSVLYSFEDPMKTPLRDVIRTGSPTSAALSEWRKDPDRDRTVTQLLKSAIVLRGKALGLSYDDARQRFFYPLDPGMDKREESWVGITRRDSRQVASFRHLPTLGRKVGIHQSVRVDFLWLDEKVFLRMEPGFVLTENGRNPLHGSEQGRALISLESWLSSLNGGYLRSVLFWRSVFMAGSDHIQLAPELVFSREPLSVKMSAGIRDDTIRTVESRRRTEPVARASGGDDA